MRITGGTFVSRTLRAPRGHATRPTSDRVREALFGILGSAGAIEGARVLDLYAGTGALALEALSRGAARATLVESSRPALDALRSNVAALGLQDRVRVVAADVRAALARLAREGKMGAGGHGAGDPRESSFDLVLADPPWALVDSGEALAVLGDLAELPGTLSATATVVLEHSSRTSAGLDAVAKSLSRVQTRRYGDTALTFYKPAILAPPRPEGAGNTSE
jgi:16S rRNA (guanine966-N2)-methyltransferase